MKKIKLLLAAMAAMVSLGVNAWDGSAGKVYLQNVGSGLWWGAGQNWGTRASLLPHAEPVTLIADGTKFKIESQVSNGGTAYYFEGDYMDNASPVSLTFTASGDYWTIANGDTYYGYDGSAINAVTGVVLGKGVDATTDNGKWRIYTEAEMLASLENATEVNGVDATFLIKDHSFGRNYRWRSDAWTMVAGNQNLSGGNNDNNCAESYHSTFTLSQTINGVPNGEYELKAQGFYRQDGSDNNNLPVFYINSDGTATFPTMGSLPDHDNSKSNSMSDASVEFSNGNYTISPIHVTVGDGKITLGAKLEGNTNLWCIFDNFTLTYYGIDVSALRDALQVQIDAVPAIEGTTTTAAYNAAKEYADGINVSSLMTEEAISAAATELSNRVNAATALKTNYARYKNIRTAVLAINNGIDVSAANTAVEAATTNEAIVAEIATIRTALTTYLAGAGIDYDNRIDVTAALIDNAAPGNSHSLDYWTNSGNPGWEYNLYEYYGVASATSKQILATELPKGYYKLTVIGYTREGYDGFIYAGEKTQTLVGVASATVNNRNGGNTWIADGNGVNEMVFNLTAATSNLEIGINSGTQGDKWTVWRSFKLEYLGENPLEGLQNQLADAATAANAHATALDGTIPADAKTAYTSAISTAAADNLTIDKCLASMDAIESATAAADACVAPYANYNALKASADILVAVSNNNAKANSTLATAITNSANVENQATPADINDVTSTLKAAMVTYVGAAEPTNDECFDLTFMIVNPHFTEGNADDPTGWTVNYPAAPEGQWGGAKELRLSTHNFEAYHKQFTLSQTIADMKKGTYKVTLQGFARHDDANVTDKTNLFCGIVTQPIKNIKDEYSTTPLTSGKPALGDTNGESSYTLNEQTVYQPNGMSGSYYFFQEVNPATNQPFYTSEVQTLIPSDGPLTIGFKCETWSDWVIWDNFHLYYYGSAIAVTIDENVKSSVYEEDVENANITLKRTFSTDKNNWNTISLPFNLTDEETKAAFGDDVEVATYSETADGTNSTVAFNIAADAAITANTPVLLKTSTDETTFTFNNKTIKAGEAKIAGTNFDFVATYDASTTIDEGSYFISSNKLYRSTGTTTIKGTRAYLKAKTAGVKALKFSIGGQDYPTAIDGLEAAPAQNGAIYNIAGQRVSKAQKGIFIVNGKKVVK